LLKKLTTPIEILNKIIEDSHTNIGSNFNFLNNRLVNLQPLKEFEEIVESACTSLEKDIDTYFGNVYIYRAGVFSIHVKEAISKLGIGKQLDDLESDFDEEFKELKKREVKEKLFPKINNLVASFANKLQKILITCKQYREEVRNLDLNNIKKPLNYSDVAIPEDGTTSTILQSLERHVNQYSQKIVWEIFQRLNSLMTEYDINIRRLKRKRRKRFTSIVLSSGLIFLIVYLAVQYLNYIPEQTISIIILLSLVSNFFGDFLGFFVAKVFDRSPIQINETKKEYEKKVLFIYDEIVDSKLKEFSLKDNIIVPLTQSLRVILSNVFETVKGCDPYVRSLSIYKRLQNYNITYQKISDEYLGCVEELYSNFSKFFSNIEANLAKLRQISQSIKEVSIEPSFKLLATTHDELRTVNEKIREISFV